MRRREFIVGLGGACVTRIGAVRAQAVEPIVGFLALPARVPASDPYFAAFERALAEAGFKPGHTIRVEYRFANNRPDYLQPLARDLVTAGANIVATPSGVPAIQAIQQTAPAISIVAIFTGDAVQSGLIKSLNRPGGNITGAIVPIPEMLEKQLELAHELIPGKAKVGVLVDASFAQPINNRLNLTADKLGIDPVIAVVANEGEIDAAFGSIAQAGVQCVVISWTPLLLTRHEQIVALAAAHHLPDIYAPSDALSRGGIMSYGSAFPEMWRLLGTQTAKIIASARPGDLPVEFPPRIELRVNLKAARERGITIPFAILSRADEVIE